MEISIQDQMRKEFPNLSHNESVCYKYILNTQDEATVINNAIEAKARQIALKMQSAGYSLQAIETRLKTIDFKAEIDEHELLSNANMRKHWQIEDIEETKKMKEQKVLEQNKLADKCNANYFFHLMKVSFEQEKKRLVVDEFSASYIKALCFFMSKDERFASELELDPNKGLWIIGVPGTGKTRLIEAISQNQLAPIKIVSMIDVADSVKSSGEYNLTSFNRVLFDDAGSEQATVNHYGTKINWLKDFLELYYTKRQSFSRLIVTTNCDFKEIEELYGYRVRSRIREMFNVFHLKGSDRRK